MCLPFGEEIAQAEKRMPVRLGFDAHGIRNGCPSDWKRMRIQYLPDADVVRSVVEVSHDQDMRSGVEGVDGIA